MTFAASLAVPLASHQRALAADWEYCLAPSYADHKVYMTDAFAARGAVSDANDAFEHALDQAGLRHDVVQCPRADDERSIAAMKQYAIAFNREIGNVVVHVRFERTR